MDTATANSVVEPLYSIAQVSVLWNVSIEQVRKIFCRRPGMVNVGSGPQRPAWRIPASMIIDVMVERGYTREAAARRLAQAEKE